MVKNLAMTNREKKIILDICNSEYKDGGDPWEGSTWTFDVGHDLVGREKSGVIGSLVKKGLVNIMDNEGNNNPDDYSIGIEGREVCEAAGIDLSGGGYCNYHFLV